MLLETECRFYAEEMSVEEKNSVETADMLLEFRVPEGSTGVSG